MVKHVIGVLALQGDFAKHMAMIRKIGLEAIEVRKPEDLQKCDALILPGGESTAILRQLRFIGLQEPLKAFAKEKPLYGTCAGLILMAKTITDGSVEPFGFIDIEVERNAFGTQVDSFETDLELRLDTKPPKNIHAVFIRAPRIRKVASDVQVLAEFQGEPVVVKQGRHLGSTFHPELTADETLHRYFLSLEVH